MDASAARGTVRLAGRAGVVAQALLLDPQMDWGVHLLAQTAGVSPGLAHKVLQRLETEGIVASSGAGPGKVRRVADPTALLDVWAEETRDRDVVRATAFRFARTPRELVWQVAHGLDVAGVAHAVSGTAAAALLVPLIAAAPPVELRVTGAVPLADVLRTVEAEAAGSEHNLVVRQARDDLPLAFRAKTPRASGRSTPRGSTSTCVEDRVPPGTRAASRPMRSGAGSSASDPHPSSTLGRNEAGSLSAPRLVPASS